MSMAMSMMEQPDAERGRSNPALWRHPELAEPVPQSRHPRKGGNPCCMVPNG